jgi:hypothetical protein
VAAPGVFWAFNSVQRVTSVGSRMFVCEAVQWEEFGAPYLPWGPTFVGPGGIKGASLLHLYTALRVSRTSVLSAGAPRS